MIWESTDATVLFRIVDRDCLTPASDILDELMNIMKLAFLFVFSVWRWKKSHIFRWTSGDFRKVGKHKEVLDFCDKRLDAEDN